MPTVKVSRRFQVVIPRKVREELKLEPGERLRVYALDGRIHMIRHRSIADLRGIAKGLKWKDEDRDHTERF